jgi:hypothetical protein
MPSPHQPECSPEQKSEPSAEYQFVQKAVNLLIQWSPLGGSVGILAHSVLQQNWRFLAALTFPVMLFPSPAPALTAAAPESKGGTGLLISILNFGWTILDCESSALLQLL